MPDAVILQPVEPEPGQPLYTTVRDAVRAAIDRGEFSAGQQLPSTKAISEQMNVSLVTVHRALQELVAAGVLQRGQGRGTFVHEQYGRRYSTGHRLGLVFHAESSLADLYHSAILEGVRQGSEEHGVDLVLLRFGEDWRNECQGYLYVNPFQEQLAKPPRFGAASRGAPMVVVGASFGSDDACVIDTDNTDIGARAADHLADLGHRRVGFVGGSLKISNNADRWTGFKERCARRGVELRDEHTLIVDDWRLDQQGRKQLARMLEERGRPTAVFAGGYHLALDIYAIASEIGLKIPRELSVIGVDDPPSAAHLSPPMTTFRQPLIELGRVAVGALFDMIEGDGPGAPGEKRAVLRTELMARGSCGPPPISASKEHQGVTP